MDTSYRCNLCRVVYTTPYSLPYNVPCPCGEGGTLRLLSPREAETYIIRERLKVVRTLLLLSTFIMGLLWWCTDRLGYEAGGACVLEHIRAMPSTVVDAFLSPIKSRLAPEGEACQALDLRGIQPLPTQTLESATFLNAAARQAESVTLSPDGLHVAYEVREQAKTAVFVDGNKLGEYDRVVPFSVAFSPDSQKVGYLGIREDKVVIVVNGVEGRSHSTDVVSLPPVFSPDGNHVAYVVRDVARDKDIIVYDGWAQESGNRDSRVKWIGFSGEGRLAWVDDEKTYQLVGVGRKRPQKEYDRIVSLINEKRARSTRAMGYAGSVFTSDNKHVGYIAQLGDEQFVVIDGREGKRFDEIDHLTYTPNGERFAYSARKGGEWVVVVGQKHSKGYRKVGESVFSPDGVRMGYAAETGRGQVMVVDDVEMNGHAVKGRWKRGFGALSPPVFSPDGHHVAFTDYGTAHFPSKEAEPADVVLDDKLVQQHTYVGRLIFSPDSKHVVYAAQNVDKRWAIFVDGRITGERYDNIGLDADTVAFESDDTFRYTARSEDELLLVREQIDQHMVWPQL